MQNKFSQNLIIPCYDTDRECRLKPSSFMDLAQEQANIHAQKLGFGYDDLQKTRTAWVLSRMHIHFVRYPQWREEVTLSTWHKGAERLFYLRDFQMKDSNGDVLVAATTSWLVLNVDTRRISRDAEILDKGTACMENAVESSCGKVQMPKGIEPQPVAVHRVSYSDVDMNGHTNNARYLLWAMDALDYSFAVQNPVKDVKINFNSETMPGEMVELYRADSDGKVYIEGRSSGRSAFCIELGW
ncbi:MAG: thioesterase [Bacteroidales bacterium]|nr:thioesterase [Bacteroides sp.]MCM1197815.1 thioesterase [Clostridium sp.]MCM1501283.1 thioesterase [Bacteroidales bacterium]